ncbi:MAG: NAD(P)-binding protein [Phenylobacterium sp.]|uniref:NAD(P)-binding protein n=1 Tax=Phenylobacterium sp. TaxID=1871053 RepID=UPI00391B0352
MTRVRIVGGGMGGVLAALEAHRQGFREIELHERSGRLGGSALPRVDHGVELRELQVRFGARGDAARDLLEWQGVAFDAVEAGCGSVSPSPSGGHVFVEDFDGPALPCRGLALAEPAGETLADRIRAYPAEMQPALRRHAEWRLGDWLDHAHADAAACMDMARVYPIGADVSTLADLRRTDEHYDELYALPPGMGGRARAVQATPREGYAAMFEAARRRLQDLGVVIHDTSLVSPHEALHTCAEDDLVLWTADPAPLFRPAGVEPPRPARRLRATYVFKAQFGRPAPFHICNFTAAGVVARLFAYESRGHTLLTAECIAEAPDGDLRREIQRLCAGFGGEALVLGDQVEAGVRSADLPSVERVHRLAELRRAVARTCGGALLVARVDPARPGPGLAALGRDLAQALAAPAAAPRALRA